MLCRPRSTQILTSRPCPPQIHAELFRLSSLCPCTACPLDCALPPAPAFLASPSNADCSAPVVGPDDVPAYDPQNDDCGFFVAYQSDNNCYAYGTDIASNSFAQPGRGSGTKWLDNTCTEMRAAAERDGLTWVGTELPDDDVVDPEKGHYLALYIWPETNFHWARRDSNGRWSHKPGGTPVQDADNNGTPIVDASKADLSPWTEFCGYMVAVPSEICPSADVCIN